MIATLQHKCASVENELAKLHKTVDSRDSELKKLTKKEEQLFQQLQDSDYRGKKLEKMRETDKIYKKEIEEKLIEFQDKIQFMEMQKKNDDLCSKLENDMPEGMGELNELEEFNGGKNMLKNIDGDEIGFCERS